MGKNVQIIKANAADAKAVFAIFTSSRADMAYLPKLCLLKKVMKLQVLWK
jgi:hypothetical protein